MALCALLAPLAGLAEGAPLPGPRKCGPATNDLHSALQTRRPGPKSHALRYVTYCGPAAAVIRSSGTTYRINPGHCAVGPGDFYAVRIGVLSIPPAESSHVLLITFREALAGAGTFKLTETETGYVHGLVHVPGSFRTYARSGTVTIGEGMGSGTFSFRVNGKHVTGTWTCG